MSRKKLEEQTRRNQSNVCFLIEPAKGKVLKERVNWLFRVFQCSDFLKTMCSVFFVHNYFESFQTCVQDKNFEFINEQAQVVQRIVALPIGKISIRLMTQWVLEVPYVIHSDVTTGQHYPALEKPRPDTSNMLSCIVMKCDVHISVKSTLPQSLEPCVRASSGS